jgi:hypothetical protein
MQSITIGKPQAYLRLTAVRWPRDDSRPEIPREKRRFLAAELHLKEVTATRELDLTRDYGGLSTFFEQVATHWQEWEGSQMVWGKRSELELDFVRIPGPGGEPDYLRLWLALRKLGWSGENWSVKTSMLVEAAELQAVTRDLRELTD